MIQRKRINNDIFVRWEILNPDETPVDLTDVLTIKAEARPQSNNASIPVSVVVVGSNLAEIQLPAKKQKYIGMYNLYLEFTKTDGNVDGGIATFTVDYTNAFELVPKTSLIPSPDDDPINIEGIIASFTYSMLTEAEKADIASRLNDDPGGGGIGYGVLGLFADAYAISVDSSDVSTPTNVKIKALPVNANTLVWTIAINNGEFQSITSNSSPYAEVFLSGNILTINSTTLSRKVYSVKVTDGVTTTGVNIIRFKASEGGGGTPIDAVTTAQFNSHINNLNNERHLTAAQVAKLDYWKLDGNGNLYTTYNMYSTGEVSAYGAGSGSGGGTGGATLLSQLNDVALTQPITNGQVLKYNVSTSKWVNADESGGSGSGGTVTWGDVTGKPNSFSPTAHTHFSTDIIGLETLLSGKMNIPTGTSSQYVAGDGTIKNFPSVGGTGTVTSITSGSGMNFTTISTTGSVTLGTPSSITLTTTNSVYTNSHTHAFNPGGTSAQYINGAGSLVTFPTIATPGNGTLSLTTEKGLTGSATFTANQAGNSTFTISPTYGTEVNTFAQGNDSRIVNGQTAYGWGNHALAGYALSTHNHSGVYEPVFSKNTAFNKDFGTTSTTVARGNDSRIVNGQTAYGWGNHALAGYVTSLNLNSYVAKTDSVYIGTTAVPLNRTSGTLDLSGIGVLSVTRVSTGSSVYFGNYGNFEGLVYDAEGAVIIGMNESNYATYLGYGNVGIGTQTPSASLHVIGNTLSTAYKLASGWSFESSGTELQIKYNGSIRNRILSDGSFVSVGEISAYGASSTGSGGSDFLSLSQGGNVAGKVGFTGTTYPQIRGNGTQLVLSYSDQVNTGTVYLVNNALRRGASTAMTLGEASYLWENTYTDKITLGNGWTIEQTSSSLTIKRNGVVKSTINA